MGDQFSFDVFLSHSSKDKAVVRPLAERLRADKLRVWFDEWEVRPGESLPAKIEEGLLRSRVLVLCMSASAFGSAWAQLEARTFQFRDPGNKERRVVPLRLDEAPIEGFLAQLLYISWRPEDRFQEYPKLLEACRPPDDGRAPPVLKLDLAPGKGVSGVLRTHGWIENPLAPLGNNDESRVKAYFARALITNVGRATVNNITLSLTGIENPTASGKPTDIQPLRWSNTWLFKAERSQSAVGATEGDMSLPFLTADDHRHCDVCFHYDLDGPDNLGRFQKGRIYFAVRNLPSNTFSVIAGEYRIKLRLAADGYLIDRTYNLLVDLKSKEPGERVRFEEEELPLKSPN